MKLSRRVLAIILAVCMLLGTIITAAATGTAGNGESRGDSVLRLVLYNARTNTTVGVLDIGTVGE